MDIYQHKKMLQPSVLEQYMTHISLVMSRNNLPDYPGSSGTGILMLGLDNEFHKLFWLVGLVNRLMIVLHHSVSWYSSSNSLLGEREV